MDIQKFIDKYEEYKTKNGTKSSVSEITVVVLDFSRWHVYNPVGGFARNDHSVHSRACQPSLEGFSGAKKRKKKKKSKENEEIIFKYKYFLRKAAPHLTEFKRGSSASFYLKGKEEVLRISNHNAAAKTFLSRGETKGCSVVIKKGKKRSNMKIKCKIWIYKKTRRI